MDAMKDNISEKERNEGDAPKKRFMIQVLVFLTLFLLLNNCPLKKFIVNRYSRKYHNYHCIYGIKIRQDNRFYIRTKRGIEELEKKGFRGCRLCLPQKDSKGTSNSGKILSDEMKQPGE